MAEKIIDYSAFTLALIFSLFIQIGANYANDYFDFIKGVDTVSRIGPARATASGWIAPSDMKCATTFVFLLAFLAAIPLMFRVGFWSFPITGLCVLFGILYTGGPKPLGYMGMGELLVLIFFGPVACCGSYYLQTFSLSFPVFIASLAPGLLSTSALVANNLRDWSGDEKAGKRTLIVRFGQNFGKWEYAACIFSAFLSPLALFGLNPSSTLSLAPLLLLPVAILPIRKAFIFQEPKELISVLQQSALILFLYTLLFCATCIRTM